MEIFKIFETVIGLVTSGSIIGLLLYACYLEKKNNELEQINRDLTQKIEGGQHNDRE